MGADSYDGSHHSFEMNEVKEKFALEPELGLRLYDKTLFFVFLFLKKPDNYPFIYYKNKLHKR